MQLGALDANLAGFALERHPAADLRIELRAVAKGRSLDQVVELDPVKHKDADHRSACGQRDPEALQPHPPTADVRRAAGYGQRLVV